MLRHLGSLSLVTVMLHALVTPTSAALIVRLTPRRTSSRLEKRFKSRYGPTSPFRSSAGGWMSIKAV